MRRLVLGLWLVTTACAGGVSYVQVAGPVHEMKAKKHADDVEVFVTTRPVRLYRDVGVIESHDSDLGIPAIRRKAAGVGCDAIVLLDAGPAVDGVGFTVLGIGGGVVGSTPTMRAVCLVYTDEKKP